MRLRRGSEDASAPTAPSTDTFGGELARQRPDDSTARVTTIRRQDATQLAQYKEIERALKLSDARTKAALEEVKSRLEKGSEDVWDSADGEAVDESTRQRRHSEAGCDSAVVRRAARELVAPRRGSDDRAEWQWVSAGGGSIESAPLRQFGPIVIPISFITC